MKSGWQMWRSVCKVENGSNVYAGRITENRCGNEAKRVPRQQVAFLEECRKIKGCGSLREDFYTRFIPEN